MIIVEEPLIPAARILDESLDELVKNGIIIGSKYVDSKIAFFLPSRNQKRTITYRAMATKKFTGTQSPTSLYPMYEPHKTQYGNITRYKFIDSF